MEDRSAVARKRLIAALENEPHAVVLLDDAGRITYVNAEWDRSALEHQAPHLHSSKILGSNYLSWIKGPMKEHAAASLQRAIAAPNQSFTFESECNTPEVHQRLTSQFVRLDPPHSGMLLHFFLRVGGPLSEVSADRAAEGELRRRAGPGDAVQLLPAGERPCERAVVSLARALRGRTQRRHARPV